VKKAVKQCKTVQSEKEFFGMFAGHLEGFAKLCKTAQTLHYQL
jgi:hypothetical protein